MHICAIKIIIKTTISSKQYIEYYSTGKASLVYHDDLPNQINLPDAWHLEPKTSNDYIWHDEEYTVAPRRTLIIQWYAFIGEEATKQLGLQFLDGEFIGFIRGNVPMDLADLFTEYTVPQDAPKLVWLPPKQLTWRNDSDRARKVIVRGWAKGGQAYSRIAVVQGGAA